MGLLKKKQDYSTLLVLSLFLAAILILSGITKTGEFVRGDDPSVAKQSSILVDTVPQGANILIDGINRGTSSTTVDVTPGSHQVVLKKLGYYDYSKAVHVSSGETIRLSVNLIVNPNYNTPPNLNTD